MGPETPRTDSAVGRPDTPVVDVVVGRTRRCESLRTPEQNPDVWFGGGESRVDFLQTTVSWVVPVRTLRLWWTGRTETVDEQPPGVHSGSEMDVGSKGLTRYFLDL